MRCRKRFHRHFIPQRNSFALRKTELVFEGKSLNTLASLQSTINYLVNKVFSWEALFTHKKSCKLTYIKTELSEKTEKGKLVL